MTDAAVHDCSLQHDDVSVRTRGGGRSLAGESHEAERVDGSATDALLVHRAGAGDAAAFEALYARHRASVTRVCRRWLRDEQLVEDAVQDTFIKAWGALASFSGGERFDRWVRRIAKNHCHSLHRAWVRRGREVASDVVDVPAPDTVGSVDSLAVNRMLAGLEPRDAALLVERHVVELSVPAMATRWGLSPGSMNVALHRARVRARRLASAEGLRGLLPVPVLRRVGAWLQRLVGPRADIAVAAAETMAPLVIAAGLALPGLAMAQADPAMPSVQAVQMVDRAGLEANAFPARQGADSNDAGPGVGRWGRVAEDRAMPGAATGQPRAHAAWRHSPVPFEPVPVPGTDHEIRQTPSEDHRRWRRVGVAIAGQHVAGYETSEDNGESAMIAKACPTVDAAPGTFCMRGGSQTD